VAVQQEAEELFERIAERYLDQRRDGRLMREWVTVPVSGRAEWEGLADQAFQFVSSGSPQTRRT
jgi:hypothetical protein